MEATKVELAVESVLTKNQGRPDLYLLSHKGIRAFMCEVLVNSGRVDCADRQELETVLAQIRGLLYICKGHLKHENCLLHTAMEARKPGSSKQMAAVHEDHEHAMRHLEQSIQQIESASREAKAILMTRLYRQLALFIADNFEHMHAEETENMPQLWEDYSDRELVDLQQKLLAEIPAELNAIFLRWMLPHVTPAERTNMLRGIRQQAPGIVFDRTMEMLKQTLGMRDWEKLAGEFD